MRPVVYVCGDVHLVEPAGPFVDWLIGLRERDPARLVILGDLFEFWVDTSEKVNDFAPLFAACADLRARGWHIDFIKGNREYTAGNRLRCALGAPLHWPRLDLEIGGRRIRIVHGDRICHDPVYHLTDSLMHGFWFQAFAWACVPWLQNQIGRSMRSLSDKRKRVYTPGLPNTRRFFIDPRRLLGAARGADVLLAGHVHQRVHCRVRGVEFALAGPWFGDDGFWLEIDAAGTVRSRSFR